MQENVRGSFSLITLKSLSEKGLSETRYEFLTAPSIPKKSGIYEVFLFAEISLEQSGESLAVAGFVMNVTEKPSNINTFFKNPTWLDTIFVL